MAEAAFPEGESGSKKKSGLIMTIAAVALLTAIGGGGGWVVGSMFGAQMQPPGEKTADAAKKDDAAVKQAAKTRKDDEGLPHISTEENNVVQLEPITTNLAFPADRWIRLEVAILFKGKPDITLAESVHQDITAYLRTVTMQQIEGPRGFLYLKEDLEDRADLITEGKVARIMFRTFVIE